MGAALRFTWRLTKWAGIAVLLSYVAVCMGMYVMQRTLVFPKLADHVSAADAGFPEAQEVALQTSDGERLVARYVPPKPDKPLSSISMATATHLTGRSWDRSLVADGSGLLAVSYRGYEGSTGSPSEEGMHLDAVAAYEFAPIIISRRTVLCCGGIRLAPVLQYGSRQSGRSRRWYSKRPILRLRTLRP